MATQMASDMQPQQRMQPAVFKFQLTLTTLIILFMAMTVFASPPPAVGLWIESAFHFKRCSEDQKNFFRSTVTSGLAAIADLNPELLNNRLSLSTTVRAEIVCSGKRLAHH